MLLRNSKKLIPGTNGEMTEHDLLILLEKLQAKKIRICRLTTTM